MRCTAAVSPARFVIGEAILGRATFDIRIAALRTDSWRASRAVIQQRNARKDAGMGARPGRVDLLDGRSGRSRDRGRYLTLQQVAEAYPAFSLRLLRRLVQERRIPFSRAGRCIVLAEADIDAYLEANRVEPARWRSA